MWRFQRPFLHDNRCIKLVFAGPHFQASLQLTRDVLEDRRRRQRQQQHHPTEVELIHAPTREELMAAAPIADIAVPFMERFDDQFLHHAPNLRLIQQFGVGLEGVNVDTATSLGICVANIPAAETGNAEATAEHALFLCLSLLRRAPMDLHQRFQKGILGALPIPRSLYGKRVTVVGYGAVGSKICEYLRLRT